MPFVAYWKGHTPSGKVSSDLIEFTDFYATLADAAGAEPTERDPIDGRSFFPQLNGQTGNPREWVLGHYQPYWGKFNGSQYARNQEFKLYRDNRFYHVPKDLQENSDLSVGSAGDAGEQARASLAAVLKNAPPPPPLQGGNKVVDRPTHPDWKNLVDPND